MEAFLNTQGEQLELLRPYLPPQFEIFLRYLRHEMGGEQQLFEAGAAALRAQLETLRYPHLPGDMPIEQRRMACLTWIVQFAANMV